MRTLHCAKAWIPHRGQRSTGTGQSNTFVTEDTAYLTGREEYGTVHTESETRKGNMEEWHYYISNRRLIMEELLHDARMKWTIETMHLLPNDYLGRGFLSCRKQEHPAESQYAS